MAVVWLALMHYYTAVTGFVAYCFLALRRIRISKVELLFINGLALLITLHLVMGDVIGTILNVRYYWGWLVFYFIFKSKLPSERTLRHTLVLLSLMTLLEALLVNTVMTTSMLPNYPAAADGVFVGDGGGSLFRYGAYQRPFSFGGLAPVGGPLIVVLMALCDVRGWRFLLSTMAILSLASGTSILSLLILLLVRYRSKLMRIALLSLVMLLPSYLLFSKAIVDMRYALFHKASLEYLILLVKLLWAQIFLAAEQIERYMFVIGVPAGTSVVSGHGGDWGLLSLFLNNGMVGVGLLIMLLLFRVNKVNRLPILIIILASVHYSAMSTLPGQMLFGLLLAVSNDGASDNMSHMTECEMVS